MLRKLSLIFILLFLIFAIDNLYSQESIDSELNKGIILNNAILDVGVTLISVPSDTVDSNIVILPTATVKNFGDTTVSFSVIFKEDSLHNYYDNKWVFDLPPDSPREIYFTPWRISLPRGVHSVKCSTALEGDVNPSNDAVQKQIFCKVTDIAIIAIIDLPDSVDYDDIFTPRARLRNSGSHQEAFWTIFQIDTVFICSLSVTNFAPGIDSILTFNPCTSNFVGNHLVSCTAAVAGDAREVNNVLYDTITVRVKDFGVSEILEPPLIIPENIPIIPKALITNYGSFPATSEVFFAIYDSLSQLLYLDSDSLFLDPQTSDSITFNVYNVTSGRHMAQCYTKLEGDFNPHNDTLIRYFFAGTPIHDVGVANILTPLGTIRRNPINPKAEIKNFGNLSETFFTFFKIRSDGNVVYFDSLLITDLQPGRTIQTTFSIWGTSPGSFIVECYTALNNDINPENNLKVDSVVVETLDIGWTELASVPEAGRASSKHKPVKAGGSLVFVSPSFIYAFKGNNTNEFYCYDITKDTWIEKETIPWVGKKKRVKDGASLCYDNGHYIYATKGKNTQEFWRYNIETDSWAALKIVPFGNSSRQRKVKKGSCITFFPRWDGQNFVYLLKGNSTFEFFAYWVEEDSWIFKQDAPSGPKEKKYKAGSCMTYDYHNNYIWTLKGGTNEFYAYDLTDSIWLLDKPDIPLIGNSGKKKKVKAGGSIAYSSATRSVYVLKGGNTNEFWHYVPGDSWFQMTDLPDSRIIKKRVKYGGSLVFGSGNLFALRGNKTNDFYIFNFGSGVGIEEPKITKPLPVFKGISLRVQPNPFTKTTKICYSLTGSIDVKIQVSIKLYNVTGQMVKVLIDTNVYPGSHNFNFNSTKLPKGIYIVRLTALNRQANQKIVITDE